MTSVLTRATVIGMHDYGLERNLAMPAQSTPAQSTRQTFAAIWWTAFAIGGVTMHALWNRLFVRAIQINSLHRIDSRFSGNFEPNGCSLKEGIIIRPGFIANHQQ